jgi:hypothetical protein
MSYSYETLQIFSSAHDKQPAQDKQPSPYNVMTMCIITPLICFILFFQISNSGWATRPSKKNTSP